MLLRTLYIALIPLVIGNALVPSDYNRNFRPRGNNSSQPLKVEIGIRVNGVHGVDTKRMTIRVHMYQIAAWTEERLIVPPDKYFSLSNREYLPVSTSVVDHLWFPDIFFRSTSEVKTFALLGDARSIQINKEKTVLSSEMYDIAMDCPMFFKNFPFDSQVCAFRLGSYFYSVDELNFQWHKHGLVIDDNVKSQLEDYDFEFVQKNHTQCPCKGCLPDTTPCIEVYLHLHRRYVAFVLSYYIPPFLFMLVSWASFFWPPHVIPGRTVLVITSLLTISSVFSSARDDIPDTSYTKAIDVWMFFCLVVAVLNLFQYAVILQIMKRKKDFQPGRAKGSKLYNNYVKASFNKYELYQRRTENVGRYGEPIIILLFNMAYWPYFFL